MNSTSCTRPGLLALAILLLVCLTAVAKPGGSTGTALHVAAGPRAGAQSPAVAASPDWQSRVQVQLAAREYEITWQDRTALPDLPGAWQVPNRAHNLRTYFTDSGIRVVPRDAKEPPWEWGLTLMRYGRPGRSVPVRAAPPVPDGNRIERARGNIKEWYVNDPRGLEHGFTLFSPPPSAGRKDAATGVREVHIDLSLTGTLDPSFSPDGQAVDFKVPGGPIVLRYAQPRVEDARGRVLPARMEGLTEPGLRGLRLGFEDDAVVYPVTVAQLATSPAWMAEINHFSAFFGGSVATAGDVNGDGFGDVLVGAPNYDDGEFDEGWAFVYQGSSSGLALTPAWSAQCDQSWCYFGSVATAGDVNRDGFSDVIVGATHYDHDQTNEGGVFLYLGSSSGLALTPAWTADGDQTLSGFGRVATAGDVNGDGFDDVLVGAPGYDNEQLNAGRASLYMSSASGLAPTPAWTAEGDHLNSNFAQSVATAGDVNGDGFSDVIVGAPFYENGQPYEGRALVYLGSAAGLARTPAWTVESDKINTSLGNSVATAGDVNGDGFSDVIIGVPSYDKALPYSNEGRALVYLGSASGLALTPAWTVDGNQLNGQFGKTVATAGDVDGDGFSDVIVGDYTARGRAYVYLGSASGLAPTPAWTAGGEQSESNFGHSVSTAGDVNGDGFSDFIVGAPQEANGGRAFVYLGSPCPDDADGDGYGSPGNASCLAGGLEDCDDSAAAVSPGAPQVCDGQNNDCNDPSWPSIAGSNETDDDGDGFSECAGDCTDANATVWGTPGEVPGLTLDGRTLSWSAPASLGGVPASVAYDTIRSTSKWDFVNSPASCVESDDGTDTTATDPAMPQVGTIFYYLIRAQNACPGALGIGPLGAASYGVPRTARNCP